MLGSEADRKQVDDFVHALQVYQLIQHLNAAAKGGVTPLPPPPRSPPPSSTSPLLSRLPDGRTERTDSFPTATAFTTPPPSLRVSLPATSASQELGCPATPPAGVDPSLLSTVLAHIQARLSQPAALASCSPATASVLNRAVRSTDTLGCTTGEAQPNGSETSSPQSVLSFSTPPQKRKSRGVPPEASCASPVDSLPSGLKRMRVRVLQSNTDYTSSPDKRAASPAACLMAHLIGKSDTPTAGTKPVLPSRPQAPRPQAKQQRLHTFNERLQMAEDSDNRAPGSWSEAEKQELIRVVADLRPCGASDWEKVANRLNENRPEGGAPRRGPSAERMYRTLTDPDYNKSTNPHGRRLNPRKGSTPMHVMATYSLQQLPDNEGNLTQITELISKNQRFSSELDWTPRPGTKTYPRWKDALVGCFKPGRYPHLMKTDRKRDGLTVYKLVKTELGQTQRSHLEESTAISKTVVAS